MYGKYFKGTHVGKGPTPGYKFGADWWLDSDEKSMSRDAASMSDI